MSAADLHDLFAVLALVALALAILLLVARVVPSVASVRFLDAVHRVQLPIAAIIAVTATTGSLWFSESAGWIPCRFCWFQRIFMYSLAVILTVAALRRDRGVKWFAAPLAIIGMCISLWHILLEHGVIDEGTRCDPKAPCAVPWAISLGTRDPLTLGPSEWHAFTLAVMAFCGFAAILALLLAPEPLTLESLEEEEDGEPQAG